MKKIHIIAIGILCVLPSCLDVKIVDRVEKESGFYKTEDHAKSAIYATYTTLTDFAYHKTNWPLILSTYEDAMFSTGSAVPATVSNNTHNPNSGPCVNFWPTLYNGINNANEIIERVPEIEFTDAKEKERIIAEAYFLRALFHYDLVRLYGAVNGIPLVLKATTGVDDAYNPQVPKEDVYAQIIEDFRYAAGENEDGSTRLPLKSESRYVVGRASNGAAHAFLAEVYLTLGQWQNAADEAEYVISSSQYSLVENYQNLWDVEQESEARKEHIFFVPFFRDKDALADNSLGSNIAHLFNPNGVIPGGKSVSGNPYGKGASNHKVQKWFIKIFQDDTENLGFSDPKVNASSDVSKLVSKDYRIEVSFWRQYQTKNNTTLELGDIKNVYPATGSGQENLGYIRKYIDPNGINNRTNENDMPRLRLADMYLIKAEALNELGDYGGACRAIDVIRERARKANGSGRSYPKYIGSDREDNIGRTLTKQEFRWLVFMERGLEFAGEQKRWFDLIRMKYDDSRDMYDYMMDTYIPSLPASDVNKQGVMAARKKYFPIPFNEVSRNKGIQQNPGY
ncbi:MAG: RagB/SusD family nutrient uptake outer membrane protein [Bacteroidales bacterium]|nr:RagB/SusD family nutrient uptake outer membrane protein [Bacteroidales bacterium]